MESVIVPKRDVRLYSKFYGDIVQPTFGRPSRKIGGIVSMIDWNGGCLLRCHKNAEFISNRSNQEDGD